MSMYTLIAAIPLLAVHTNTLCRITTLNYSSERILFYFWDDDFSLQNNNFKTNTIKMSVCNTLKNLSRDKNMAVFTINAINAISADLSYCHIAHRYCYQYYINLKQYRMNMWTSQSYKHRTTEANSELTSLSRSFVLTWLSETQRTGYIQIIRVT